MVSYFWVWDLLWIYPVIIYWRKLIFLFASKYQLWLSFPGKTNNFCHGWDVVSTSPPCCQNFIWLEFVQDLHMLSRSLWVCMCICPLKSELHCFTGVIYYLTISQSSCLLFHRGPWVLRVWFWWGHCI